MLDFKKNKIEFCVLVLLFGLLAVFLIHNFDSIGQDIGRHLKIGEIIWQTGDVPKANLFSFTEPDFSFINHHWLSEVVFFKLFSWFRFTGLILIKTFLILIAFGLLFWLIKKRAKFWPLLVSFLLAIFIFISRTEVRPEIFSFVILSFFLLALFKSKYENDNRYLWFLPFAQLLWVNLHIYFFIGPLLFLFFLIDEAVNNKVWKFENWKLKIGIFILIVFANLANPNFVSGALYPFRVLSEYGYSIVENQTLAFLAPFFGFNLSIFIFKLSAVATVVSFILTVKKARQRTFEILVSTFFIYAGFRMLRNLPLYALMSFPILAMSLSDIQGFIENKWPGDRKKISGAFKISIFAFLIFFIFFVGSNSFYKHARLSRTFGFSVPNGLERAVDFVRENKIKGPMFNNFDIGGYLIWKLYPDERVFVDNRPEAYSVKFFSEIYKPMQEDRAKWIKFSEKYGINFIFFGHTDATPWGQTFLENIVKDASWKIVYINESATILLKNNKQNTEIISRLTVSEANAAEKSSDFIKNSNGNKTDANLALSRVFYNFNWRKPSLYFSEEAVKNDPRNRYGYLNKGLVHVYYADMENQRLAAESIKKAIDLGLKDSQYYYILGVIYMNLGRLEEAKTLFIKALEIDKNNKQAREFLDKYF